MVFFARCEASQYGSHLIETEHLLAGLLREDYPAVRKHLPEETHLGSKIREEIERRTTRAERISTSVEVPLSDECKKALTLAVEVAGELGHRHIDTEHVLFGLLKVEASMAAQILRARGLTAETVQKQLAKAQGPQFQASAADEGSTTSSGLLMLNAFIDGLRTLKADDLIAFLGQNAEFIDVTGKLWNREKISRNFDALFSPYAKRNATSAIESTVANTDEIFVATVLWKNALLASEQRAWLQRMSVVLVAKDDEWEIVQIQVTLVQP